MTDESTAQLESEVSAALNGAPPEITADPTAGTEVAPVEAPPDHLPEWQMFMGHTSQLVSAIVLPQWELTDLEKNELAASLAGCLNQLFPDGLDGKYACWFRLVACAGGITAMRAIKHGGKIPGFGPKRPPKDKPPESASAAEAPAAPH